MSECFSDINYRVRIDIVWIDFALLKRHHQPASSIVRDPIPLVSMYLARWHVDLAGYLTLSLKRRVATVGVKFANLLGQMPDLHGRCEPNHNPAVEQETVTPERAEVTCKEKCGPMCRVNKVGLQEYVSFNGARSQGYK